MRDKHFVGGFEDIGNLDRLLTDVTHSPNSAVGLVSRGIGAWNLVVRHHFVVPVSDIETAVGAEGEIYGTEPIVLTFQQIFQVGSDHGTGFIAINFDVIDGVGDRIGKQGCIRPLARKAARIIFTEGQPRKPCSADAELMKLGNHRLVGAELVISDSQKSGRRFHRGD